MNYAFVINNKTCIGCHACSTACKSENDVPLGVYRTWVKYVEKGEFPHTKRHFQVTRCNHCANPPCVRICPVTAMYQRDDGIVEFDPEVCIGCKACMQACPYDAIYIDPNSHTAAKCHFCAHRTDLGLQPACVVVCPTQSIIAGDMDDPNSHISHILSREQVTVRKPEQGTRPKLFYIEGDDVALTPTASSANYMWAEQISHQNISPQPESLIIPLKTASSGTPIRTPQTQGAGEYGPIQIGQGRMAEQMVQTSYNAQHKVPWHWPVPAYLVTKGIASGIFMLIALIFGLNLVPFEPVIALSATFIALIFTGLTTALLVLDLDKPSRFISIVFRPQMKSWLARGAFILIGFSSILGIWFLLEGLVYLNWLNTAVAETVRPLLLVIGSLLALGTAIYTAFLFGQAEGRDLWQSPLLPVHLVIQALMVGSISLLTVTHFIYPTPTITTFLLWTFGLALLSDLFVTLAGEFGMPHPTETSAKAAHLISHGKYRWHFWGGSIVLGHIIPLALLFLLIANPHPVLSLLTAVCTIVGLYLYEYAFVMAPQEIPNS